MSTYAVNYLPTHLIAVERWGDLESVLTDLDYLEAKYEAGWIFGLSGDFSRAVESLPPGRSKRRIVQLLDEAIRRDIHFIAGHRDDYPQALFQCLWNSCWWCDCDDAATYYKSPPEGWPPGGPPWERMPSSEKICNLMEKWLAIKEVREQSFRWCRSLRPPLHPLDAGQKAVLRGHSDIVNDLVFSPDERQLITASNDGSTRIWDVRTGVDSIRMRDSARWAHSVSVSSDGDKVAVASGSTDGAVRVHQVTAGQLMWSLPISRGRATAVAFQPGTNVLASGGHDGVLRADFGDSQIWQVQMDGPIIDLSFSGDGRYLVVTTAAGTVAILASDTATQLWQVSSHGTIRSASSSHQGDAIAVASNTGQVAIYQRQTKMEIRRWNAHSKKINRIRYSSDDRYVACASDDHTASVWRLEDTQCLVRLHGHENQVRSLCFSKGGDLLATTSRDRTARVWSLNECITSPVIISHSEWIRSVQLSPDKDVYATSSDDGSIRIWNASDGSPLECLRGHAGIVRCIAFSPDGWWLISGSDDNTIRIWDLETYAEQHCLEGHDGEVRSVAIHPDGDYLVSCSFDDTIRIWDFDRGTEVKCFRGQDEGLRQVGFTEDGSLLRCDLYDGTKYFLDAESEQIVEHHDASIDEEDDPPWSFTDKTYGTRIARSGFPAGEYGVPDLALATVDQETDMLAGVSGKEFFLDSLSLANFQELGSET